MFISRTKLVVFALVLVAGLFAAMINHWKHEERYFQAIHNLDYREGQVAATSAVPSNPDTDKTGENISQLSAKFGTLQGKVAGLVYDLENRQKYAGEAEDRFNTLKEKVGKLESEVTRLASWANSQTQACNAQSDHLTQARDQLAKLNSEFFYSESLQRCLLQSHSEYASYLLWIGFGLFCLTLVTVIGFYRLSKRIAK